MLIYLFSPERGNWYEIDWTVFEETASLILAGRSPYEHGAYFNPPWVIAALLPIASLPFRIGAAINAALNVFVFGAVVRTMGATWRQVALVVFSPFVLYGAWNSNIDWMVVLGFLMPPQIGLFFVLAKPQIGAGIAAYWFYEAWRRGGVKEVYRVFVPVGLAYSAALLYFGVWFEGGGYVLDAFWNYSLFPAALPIGLALLVSAIRTGRKGLAIIASPFFSPYLALHSWAIVLCGMVAYPAEMSAAVAGMWVVWFLRGPVY